MMIVHGTKDSLASYDDSEEFYKALVKYREAFNMKKQYDQFVQVRGGHHAFGYLVTPRALALADAMYEYSIFLATAQNLRPKL